MTKRKAKSNNKLDDSLVLLEPSVAQPRALKEYAVPVAIFLIFAVGGSTAVWFCSQQQQTIDSLTESLNAMQLRITKFQQQLGIGNAQGTSVGVFEERLQALEEAYTRAQEKAEVALVTSEKIQSTDLNSQVWALESEMNTKLSELQQTTVSTATLNAVLKNKTEELEKLKQRIKSVLSANSEVSVSISGLTDTVLITTSRLDEQISAVESLTSRLELQKTELASLKESFADNQKALERNRQEVIDIKDLLEMEQVRRTQALEDQLMSVRRSLEDHQKSTRSLHSHLAAQLEIVQSQMSSQSQQSSAAEDEIQVKEHHVETEEELVSIKDEEVNEEENRTVTEEEANAGDVHVEAVEEHVITEKEEPAEDVFEEEGVEEQADEDEMPEEQVKEGVSEDQAVTDENEQADEVQVKEDVPEEQVVTGREEIPEELEFRDDVVEDQMVSKEEKPAEELEVKEDAEDQVGSEEEEPAEDLHVQGEKNIRDYSVIEEDVIPEEDHVKDEVVAEKQDATEEDEVPDEHGEVADEEQTDEAQTDEAYSKEDLTTTEESESNANVNAAVGNPSEDQLVEDSSQEESQQDSFEEPLGEQIDLEKLEHVYDSEEEEPAEELVEELDE